MKRRDFLITAGMSAAALARLHSRLWAQAGALPDRGKPAAVSPAKLERVSIMTYNFTSVMKLESQPASPESDTRALRHRGHVRRHLRRAQRRSPALASGLDRRRLPQGASRADREGEVADDADQCRVRPDDHLRRRSGSAQPGHRSDHAVGGPRGGAQLPARDDQSGSAHTGEQGSVHGRAAGDG